MKNNVWIWLAASLLLASCGGNLKSVSLPDDFNSTGIISSQNHLQHILGKEMVAKAVNVPVNKIEEHIENNISAKGQYTILYSWATGERKKVGNGKHEIDVYHSVSIGFVKQMGMKEFESYYGTNAGVQKTVDDMAKQQQFNKEAGLAEARYLAEYARKRQIEKLKNIATLAFWETPMNALHVLAKDAVFTITANFGDDEALARATAVQLTEAILNR